MDLNIHGKSAIICASSKGLGKACALDEAAYLTAQNILMDGGLFPGTL